MQTALDVTPDRSPSTVGPAADAQDLRAANALATKSTSPRILAIVIATPALVCFHQKANTGHVPDRARRFRRPHLACPSRASGTATRLIGRDNSSEQIFALELFCLRSMPLLPSAKCDD